MTRVRLRWRLAVSHAALALLLVVLAAGRIEYQSRRAEREQAVAGVEHDADVLAARASRVFELSRALRDLMADENQAARRAAVVGPDGTLIAGRAMLGDGRVRSAVDHVLQDGEPATAGVVAGAVVSASPVVVDDALVAVAVQSEELPRSPSSLLAQTLADWEGLVLVAAAALMGWLLAGRVARPIVELTEQARGAALGGHDFRAPVSRVPEVATLTASIAGLAHRERKHDDSEADRRQALRTLARRLSHQLRTPLSVLRLRLDDLQDPALDPDRRTLVAEVMSRQIELLDGLGDELASIDPARWELARSPVDLAALAARVVLRHGPLARWGGVALREESQGPAWVIGDEGILEDAVANVVQNAVKFTPRGGRIAVVTRAEPDSVSVVVSDSGPGIQPSERGLILHSGVRGSAASATEGTGHGLSLVADALDRHGGHLELDDTPGGGATVRLVLPAAGLGG